MKPSTLWTILIGVAVFCATVFTGTLFYLETQKSHLPVYGKIRPFTLTDSSGKEFKLADLDEKVWVANFFFTTCSGICPIMGKNMANLYRSYKLEKDVRFVSISVNPDNDTPERLTEYAKRYDADTDQWHFITGPRERLQELAIGSFKLGSVEEPVFHSSSLVLVDRNNQIRGYYDGTSDEGARELFKDLAKVLRE